MLKTILAALAGLIFWLAAVSLINLAMRHGWPAYALVERTYEWTLGMQLCRLANAAISSIAAGYVAARIAPASRAPLYLGLLLLALSLPVHIVQFAKMPLWYHAVYLLTLVPLVVAGGRLHKPRA